MIYLLIAAVTILITLLHIYLFTVLGKKTLTISGVLGEFSYIFAYFYFIAGYIFLLFFQGDVQKHFEISVPWQLGILPAAIGFFLGLWIFRKDIKLIKARPDIHK